MSNKLSGIDFPTLGKRVYPEDWEFEQESKSIEIIDRDKDLFGTGFLVGGTIAVGSSSAKVDLIDETIVYDSEGKRVKIPPTANIPVPVDVTCKIVFRHKFDEEEFTSPSNVPSDGPIIHKTNSYEIIARQGALAEGDIPVREIITTIAGVVTLGDDYREFKGISGKNVKDDQISNNHLHPDIKTGLLSELNPDLIAAINPDEANPLNWVKAINKIYEEKEVINNKLNNVIAKQIPLGSVVSDNLDFLDPIAFPLADGTAKLRSLFDPMLLGKLLKTVSSITPGTDRLNVINHGKNQADLVKFGFTGGGITALIEYFVRNPTQNDFQVSLTKTGAIVDLTSDQTGEMLTDIAWGFGNGSSTLNVPDERGIGSRGAGLHGTLLKANGSAYDGGSAGQVLLDMAQDHTHPLGYGSGGSVQSPGGGNNSPSVTGSPISNGPNGLPRTGDETRGVTRARKRKVRIS